MKKISQFYFAPEAEEITFSSTILSGSPTPGGNEDVGYEDWGD